MRGQKMLYAMNYVNQMYVEEAAEVAAPRRRNPYIQCFAAAACLCLALLGMFRIGAEPVIPGPDGPGAVVAPPVISQSPAEVDPKETDQPIPPLEPQKVTINWRDVVVNESAGMGADATRLYRDLALYSEEQWDKDQVREYFGWELAPAYIPEGLTGGGHEVAATAYRDKATGEIIEDTTGRGFWVDFYEDGSPKSDDSVVIPKGFTVVASRLGILSCGLLPAEDVRVTQFDRTEVTLTHASLPYGPFDPPRKDPSGLYNMPAGYYDVYMAAFELDGVHYEVEAQRLELEELIKIVASIIKPNEDIIVGVGCGMP